MGLPIILAVAFVAAAWLVAAAIPMSLSGIIRQPRKREVVRTIGLIVLGGAGVSLAMYQTSGSQLFRRYVAEPMPPSVQVLESEYQGGLDPAAYLHFRLERGDLAAIMSQRDWTRIRAVRMPGVPHPDWWDPQSLESPTAYSWEQTRDGIASNAAWLWVSGDGREAYFAHWNF
jgi:hypothetical protein